MPPRLAEDRHRPNLTSALAISVALASSPLRAADVSGAVNVSLTVDEMVQLDFSSDGAPTISFEITNDCELTITLCIKGDPTIDFLLSGNTDVGVSVQPEAGFSGQIGNRVLGIFEYVTDPSVEAPPIYYDLDLDIIREALGREAFTGSSPVAPQIYTFEELQSRSADWTENVDLMEGLQRGRIYVQPFVDSASAQDGVPIIAPGIYRAAIDLFVTPR